MNLLDNLIDLDAVLITHAHLDHSGSLPYIYSNARNVPFYATRQTKEIIGLLLNDLRSDVPKSEAEANVRLFNKLLIDNTVDNIKTVNFNESFYLKNLKITFFPAGHILGAAMVYIESEDKKILISGDFSSFKQFTVDSYLIPENLEVDILVIETTYGYNNININYNLEIERINFIEQISRRIENGSTILIPAYAVGRTQEIALIFKDYFRKNNNKSFPIFIGGLAVNASKIYEHYGIEVFDENIKILSSYSKKAFKNSLIIASSGMLLKNSTSYLVATQIFDADRNMICFSGYLDEDSPGKTLLKLQKGDKFDNKYEIHAEITTYRLSAHSNLDGIKELVNKVNPQKIILIHGIPDYSFNDNIFFYLTHNKSSCLVYQSFNEIPIYF